MKQIYSFEAQKPPRLTERSLREELARRRLRRQLALLGAATVLTLLALVLFSFYIVGESVMLASISIAAFGGIVIEDGIVGVLFFRRHRYFTELS